MYCLAGNHSYLWSGFYKALVWLSSYSETISKTRSVDIYVEDEIELFPLPYPVYYASDSRPLKLNLTIVQGTNISVEILRDNATEDHIGLYLLLSSFHLLIMLTCGLWPVILMSLPQSIMDKVAASQMHKIDQQTFTKFVSISLLSCLSMGILELAKKPFGVMPLLPINYHQDGGETQGKIPGFS